MKLKIFICAAAVFAVSLIAYSQLKNEAFAPAGDFPRGALVYVQIEDLPAFIKLWNESELKKNYLESENFTDFSNAHLGRKLASRWREFNEAAGFEFDLQTVSAFSQNRAAVALYDVGKLEFVFIAPVSDEIFAATKFVQNEEKFTSETLEDGTEIFRSEVKADRGRQKQELLFTHLKDRLIIATSAKLLAQTVRNIEGEKSKNRLADQPDFAALKDKITTHTASVWLDQTALNEDYYFRRYWLMSDAGNLKNIRAGIFDLEIGEEKFIEHRRFLLKESENIASIDEETAEKILSFAPDNLPFYQLKTTNAKITDEAIRKTVFPREIIAEKNSGFRRYYSSDDDYYAGYYENLGESYDEAIDDDEEDFSTVEDIAKIDLSVILQRSKPQAVLTFGKPEILSAPRFINFKQAAVFSLNAPQNFDRQLFETTIAQEFFKNITVKNSGAELKWETVSENNLPARELRLPMLGFGIDYILEGNILVLSNDRNFLSDILSSGRKTEKPKINAAELTFINLAERENDFDRVFTVIEKDANSKSFFTGNISGLLDTLGDIKKISIEKKYVKDTLEEEIVFYK